MPSRTRTPVGAIGHVDRRSVLIPAGAVTRIDTEAQAVRVSVTQDEIKGARRFTTDSETAEHGYLSAVGDYYISLRRPLAPGPEAGR